LREVQALKGGWGMGISGDRRGWTRIPEGKKKNNKAHRPSHCSGNKRELRMEEKSENSFCVEGSSKQSICEEPQGRLNAVSGAWQREGGNRGVVKPKKKKKRNRVRCVTQQNRCGPPWAIAVELHSRSGKDQGQGKDQQKTEGKPRDKPSKGDRWIETTVRSEMRKAGL